MSHITWYKISARSLLAVRLQSQPLEDWLIWESNGYPEKEEVPAYRIWALEVKGHFAGPFDSGIRNAPIPLHCLPEALRQSYERYECRQSIASVEATLEKNEGGIVHVTTGDLSLVLGPRVYQGQRCVYAWAEFGEGSLVELLNGVRNRILDFVLAVWKEESTSGDVNTAVSTPLGPDRVTQIFHTTVLGGAVNFAGSSSGSTVAFSITAKDFSSLENFLREAGVEDDDIQDLKPALESDGKPDSKEKLGPMVSAWIAKMMQKAADGSWGIGVGAAGNLLAQTIAKFYGF